MNEQNYEKAYDPIAARERRAAREKLRRRKQQRRRQEHEQQAGKDFLHRGTSRFGFLSVYHVSVKPSTVPDGKTYPAPFEARG